MARNESRLKLGYYPLVPGEGQRLRRFLELPPECAVLDPCAGTGAALRQITGEAQARRYGIELDSFRAMEAGRALDEVVQGSVFDTHCAVESYSLLYLNPPYDDEIAEGRNQRMERVFLEHSFRWLRPGGVLVLIIPGNRIASCSDAGAYYAAELHGDITYVIRLRAAFGEGFAEFGHPKDALVFFDGALNLARATPDAGFPFTAYLGRGRALIALGRTTEGESILRKALNDAQRDHMRVREARVLVALGDLLKKRGDEAEARASFERASQLS